MAACKQNANPLALFIHVFLCIFGPKMLDEMKKQLTMGLTALALASCGTTPTKEAERTYFLEGAWLLQQVEYPTGEQRDYAMEGSGTFCHLYGQDSTLYECRMATTPSGMVIMPTGRCSVTLVDKGGGELLYLENGDPHPLTIVNDTSITIQMNGTLYSWARADSIYHEWGTELRDFISRDVDADAADGSNRYVLSAKERQQAHTIHWLIIAIALIVLLSAQVIIFYYRGKRRLQLQLRQIQEEHDDRALSVREAMMAEEERFFASDDYALLQRRIATGQLLKDEEWADVENRLKRVYPGFTNQLRSLHPMSELEYQTCLLIKLRIAPKDMATVLARDMSTISTVRSRLYKKVFGQKGGAKEWDEFIISIAT